jgi:HEAT repeat protein
MSDVPSWDEVAHQIERLSLAEALECRQIAETLRQVGPEAVEPLLAAIAQEDANVRAWAAWTLGEIGDPRAVPALLHTLDDPVWNVRGMAAAALGKIGDPRAVEPLAARLGDAAAGVRWGTAEALERLVAQAVDQGDLSALGWLRTLDRWSVGWRHPGLRQAVQGAIAALEAQVAHIPDTALSRAAPPADPSPSNASLSRARPRET